MTKLFEIKTGKGSVFAKVFELVQSYIKEINIKITPEGFFISSYDLSNLSLTKIDLLQNKFEFFQCEKPLTIGVNTQTIYRTIKSISKKDTLTFYIDSESPDKLCILLADPSGISKEYHIPLLMINSNYIEISNDKFDEFNHVINLPTARFKSIIKDFDLMDTTTIEIKSFNKKLSFKSCDGDVNSVINAIELSAHQKKNVAELLQGEDIKQITYSKCDDQIIQGKFNLRKMKILIKATNLCEYMNIYLRNDSPLILQYNAADLGPFSFFLNPLN